MCVLLWGSSFSGSAGGILNHTEVTRTGGVHDSEIERGMDRQTDSQLHG